MFHVGQKVVCVDDSTRASSRGFYPGSEIHRGKIYTIKQIGVAVGGFPGVRLQEVRLCGFDNGEPFSDNFYKASRFRPIVEKKTDTGMAILKKILERERFDERIRQPAR